MYDCLSVHVPKSRRPDRLVELKEGAKPYHGRPYTFPKIHKATLMKEIDCLISIGVLKWQPLSKWASPSFIIPKKDLTVCTISDFRELNKIIVRNPYSFPQNQYHLVGAGRLHICNHTRLKHGLRYNQVRLHSCQDKLSYSRGVNTHIRDYHWDLPDWLIFSKRKWETSWLPWST
jgi:hypothetical protein